MSHWQPVDVYLSPSAPLTVVTAWAQGTGIRNVGNIATQVYMELEVVRVRGGLIGLPDTTLVRTLPGVNRFTEDTGRPDLVRLVTAYSVSIAPGELGPPAAVVQLWRDAAPDGARLKVVTRVRRVDNPNGASPDEVGPVVAGGFHEQSDVIRVHWV